MSNEAVGMSDDTGHRYEIEVLEDLKRFRTDALKVEDCIHIRGSADN
jgi:hypothetical protein